MTLKEQILGWTLSLCVCDARSGLLGKVLAKRGQAGHSQALFPIGQPPHLRGFGSPSSERETALVVAVTRSEEVERRWRALRPWPQLLLLGGPWARQWPL